MAVVINDFEVLPAQQAAQSGDQAAAGNEAESADKEKIEPRALAPALHCLHVQALRIWAH